MCRPTLSLLLLALPSGLAAQEPSPVGRVLVQLRTAAEANAHNAKKTGDPLAELIIREAARFSQQERIPAKDFLIALGLGLDRSDTLRKHPLTRRTFQPFGADVDRERRLKALGEPTMRKRHDWLLHFSLSAALTAATNAETAQIIGLGKELQDALGPSGFSFADLAADEAGIAFARQLLAHPERLRDVAASFAVEDFLPPLGDLEENLSLDALTSKYGGPDGVAFRAAYRDIRRRVDDQPIFKMWMKKGS